MLVCVFVQLKTCKRARQQQSFFYFSLSLVSYLRVQISLNSKILYVKCELLVLGFNLAETTCFNYPNKAINRLLFILFLFGSPSLKLHL